MTSKRRVMPRKYSRQRRRSSKKRTKTNKKSKKMRGGVTRKLLTRRKVADLTREIGLGHGGSLNTRIKEFVRPALTNRSIRYAVQETAIWAVCRRWKII